MSNFPTSVSPQQLWGLKPEPDPPPSDTKRFWVLCVPLGFVVGLGLSVFIGTDVLLPGWGVSTLLLWASGVGGTNMTKTDLRNFKKLSQLLRDAANLADRLGALTSGGAEIGSLIGSVADELEVKIYLVSPQEVF